MKYGSIAAGHKTTVESARNILERGGNAFDAAVGAVFTSMISEFNLHVIQKGHLIYFLLLLDLP